MLTSGMLFFCFGYYSLSVTNMTSSATVAAMSFVVGEMIVMVFYGRIINIMDLFYSDGFINNKGAPYRIMF